MAAVETVCKVVGFGGEVHDPLTPPSRLSHPTDNLHIGKAGGSGIGSMCEKEVNS